MSGGRLSRPSGGGPDRRRLIGAAGEAAAAAHLIANGYEVLDSNWRCRYGELDLVAAKPDVLVFVEVRAKSSGSLGRFGTPQESVGVRKRQKLLRLAEAYLQRMKDPPPARIRFDLIAVVIDRNEGRPVAVEHIENAF